MTDKKSFDDQINDIDDSLLKLKEDYEKRRNALRLKKSAVKAKQNKEFRKRRTHYLIQLGSTIDAAIKKHINNTDNEMASWLIASDANAKGDEEWQRLYQYLLNNQHIIPELLHFKDSQSTNITSLYLPGDNELKGRCVSAAQRILYLNCWHVISPILGKASNQYNLITQQHCIDFLAFETDPSIVINIAKNPNNKSIESIFSLAKQYGFEG